ncbi:hypothetical protein GPECTOR_13g657 [Gonium pectorale]|uniref:Uncharacterized protein n=1 Tax=Gonium pectorale TaxID=33097 RepID=A0A150GPB9_GONPE|nr:hypothetical protein GPECTOR_13g657 [Gonium pectorale]|eukprot:KXZ51170.1 hypothetical protein GPECTOR_13g657 [Gonium pectorale]
MTETAVFLEEIAVSQTPQRLQGLMRVLEARGGQSLSPSERRGLHPLLVPLSAVGEDVTCLLRWPEPSQYKTSAMVAAEWYMRNGHFVGWARPYEFASDLFTQLGRNEEGRDMARMALRLPWWTLRAPFASVAATAALPYDADRVMYLLSEEAAAAASATVNRFNYREPKTAKQIALDRATALMNKVVAGDLPSYDSIRGPLAEAYAEAGLSDVANFIQAA